MLLSLPYSESTTTEEFIANARIHSKEKGITLQQCSQKVERSVQELLLLLRDNAMLSAPIETDSHEKAQAKKGFCAFCVKMSACFISFFFV